LLDTIKFSLSESGNDENSKCKLENLIDQIQNSINYSQKGSLAFSMSGTQNLFSVSA